MAAAEKTSDVIVLEKRSALGGNSAMAEGFLAAESPAQKRMNIDARRDEIFRMATLNGSSALGFSGTLGRLRSGFMADMTILELPQSIGRKNLLHQILEGAGKVIGTMVQGKINWNAEC